MRRQLLRGCGNRARVLATFCLAAALAACDAGTAPGTGRIQVLLTDAPHEELDSALVWISRIYLVGGGAEDDTLAADSVGGSGRVDLYNRTGSPLVFDLLKLRDGITADLTGEREVDVGAYQGLRLVVDSARVHLAEGTTFTDGSSSARLRIPSGHTSGIKVQLGDVLRVEEGRVLTLIVDFDVDDNFRILRAGPGAAVSQVLFTPVLKEKGREGS